MRQMKQKHTPLVTPANGNAIRLSSVFFCRRLINWKLTSMHRLLCFFRTGCNSLHSHVDVSYCEIRPRTKLVELDLRPCALSVISTCEDHFRQSNGESCRAPSRVLLYPSIRRRTQLFKDASGPKNVWDEFISELGVVEICYIFLC